MEGKIDKIYGEHGLLIQTILILLLLGIAYGIAYDDLDPKIRIANFLPFGFSLFAVMVALTLDSYHNIGAKESYNQNKEILQEIRELNYSMNSIIKILNSANELENKEDINNKNDTQIIFNTSEDSIREFRSKRKS